MLKKQFFITILLLSFFLKAQDYESLARDFENRNDVKEFNLDAANLSAEALELERLMALNEQKEEFNDEDSYLQDNFFGFSYFMDSPKVGIDQNNLGIPFPSEYKISFGDELRVVYFGKSSKILSLTVGANGNVILPEVGGINLYGLSIDEASKKIGDIIKTSLIGTEVSVDVVSSALRKVNIIGAVKTPGVYIVSPYSSLMDVLKQSGGLLKNASLRRIKVISIDGDERSVDLYDFLVNGNPRSNPILFNGDSIKIETTQNFVSIEGKVNRPLYYEYLSNDDYKKLINFALGFTPDSEKNSFFITFEESKSISFENKNDYGQKVKAKLKRLIIPTNIIDSGNFIEIKGSVVESGLIKVNNKIMLGEIISNLDFSDEIYPFYFKVELRGDGGQIKRFFSSNIYDLQKFDNEKFNGSSIITFYSKDEINAVNEYIAEDKKFQNLLIGLREESDSRNLESDYKLFGYLLDENFNEIKKPKRPDYYDVAMERALSVISRDDLEISFPAAGKVSINKVANFFDLADESLSKITIGDFKGMQVLSSKSDLINFDSRVVINSQSIEKSFIKVKIEGEVYFPGEYTISRKTTLADLYRMAGGITSEADERSIFFSRLSIRNSQREEFLRAKSAIIEAAAVKGNTSVDSSLLSLITNENSQTFPGRYVGDFSQNSKLSSETWLANDDLIIIPKQRKQVSITGEVLSPITIDFNPNHNLEDYVRLGGGYTSDAKKRDIYVVTSEGYAVPINRFFRENYIIQPGDTIIVPRDYEKLSTLPLIATATKVISDIAFSAASLNAIRN